MPDKKEVEARVAEIKKRVKDIRGEAEDRRAVLSSLKQRYPTVWHAVSEDFKRTVAADPNLSRTHAQFQSIVTSSLTSMPIRQREPFELARLAEWLAEAHDNIGMPRPREAITILELEHNLIQLNEEKNRLLSEKTQLSKTLKSLQKKRPRPKPEPAPVEEPASPNPLEQLVSKHESDLTALERQFASLEKRDSELAGRFDQKLAEKIPSFDSLPLEDKAAKALEAVAPGTNLLHDAVARVCSHTAARAAGIAALKNLSHELGNVRYVEPAAVTALSAARQALLAGRVASGYDGKSWEYITELNDAASKHFSKFVEGGFDPTEPEHWNRLSILAEKAYSTMRLHTEIAEHIARKASLRKQITQKRSDLAEARKRLERPKA